MAMTKLQLLLLLNTFWKAMVKLTNQGVPADAAADRLQEIYGHGGISMSKILLKLVKDKGLKDYYNKYPVSSV